MTIISTASNRIKKKKQRNYPDRRLARPLWAPPKPCRPLMPLRLPAPNWLASWPNWRARIDEICLLPRPPVDDPTSTSSWRPVRHPESPNEPRFNVSFLVLDNLTYVYLVRPHFQSPSQFKEIWEWDSIKAIAKTTKNRIILKQYFTMMNAIYFIA